MFGLVRSLRAGVRSTLESGPQRRDIFNQCNAPAQGEEGSR